jgi:hypothetical protein
VKTNPDDLIGINKRLGLPRDYRFNPALRRLSLFGSIFAFFFCMWFAFFRVNLDFPILLRILPFAVMFVAVQSFISNVTSLDRIRFEQKGIVFHYIMRKPVYILWEWFRRMEFSTQGFRAIKITYESSQGIQEYRMTITFNHVLEIVNSIAEMCPQLEYDSFMKNVVVNEQAKAIEGSRHADS